MITIHIALTKIIKVWLLLPQMPSASYIISKLRRMMEESLPIILSNNYTTQWKCKKCNMPICMIDHSNSDKYKAYVRSHCIEDHLKTHAKVIGCGFISHFKFSQFLDPFKYPPNLFALPSPSHWLQRKESEKWEIMQQIVMITTLLINGSTSLGRQMISNFPLKELFLAMREMK